MGPPCSELDAFLTAWCSTWWMTRRPFRRWLFFLTHAHFLNRLARRFDTQFTQIAPLGRTRWLFCPNETRLSQFAWFNMLFVTRKTHLMMLRAALCASHLGGNP